MTYWYQHRICVIDFETTSVDPHTCQPVEVAAAVYQEGVLVCSSSRRCNPGCEIPAAASAIHGIRNEDVADAVDPQAALAEVLRAVDFNASVIPAAYNAPYDAVIFNRLAASFAPTRYSVSQWLDPLVWVREVDRYERGKGRHTLLASAKRHGVQLEQSAAHGALADAVAAGQLLFQPKLRSRLSARSIVAVLAEQAALADRQNAEFQAWKAKQPT